MYGGWKGIRITRSIESIAGSFNLRVSDRWGMDEQPWPIREEDRCVVTIDDEAVIDGFVDKRTLSLDAENSGLVVSGRDRAAALVDNSALAATFKRKSVLTIAQTLAEPFGVRVTLAPGLALPRPERKIAVNPGDTIFAVIQRAAKAAGVLLVSDGAGGLVITQSGTERVTTQLVQGENVKAASVEYDGSDRFHRYIYASQVPATDEAAGNNTRTRGEAFDDNVRRTERVQWMRPEKGLSRTDAQTRADWEARTRAAQSETVSITVRNWTQADGSLWPLNRLVFVEVPRIGVNGDMLISEIEHSLDDAGELTSLRLVRPDAFTPEPRTTGRPGRVRARGKGSRWKELEGGA